MTSPLLRLARATSFALLLVVACSSSPSTGIFGAGLATPSASSEIMAMERAMFARLNRDRANKGLPALAYDERLADIGRYHSTDMREKKFFAHESPTSGTLEDRLDRAGYLAANARENLAEGPNIEGAQDGLLKSPGHYANIMAPDITHVGIGIVQGGVVDGRNLSITQVFATPLEPVDPSAAGDIVLQTLNAKRRAAGVGPVVVQPLLQELAEAHIDELPDDIDPAAAERIGDEVVARIAKETASGLSTVEVVGARILDPRDYQPPAGLMRPTIKLGIAVVRGHDERGRPALKVLVLAGR
jgi:uncharacterized protein YkwD